MTSDPAWTLMAQPQVALASGAFAGVEFTAQGADGRDGAALAHAARTAGRLEAFDEAVWAAACARLAAWAPHWPARARGAVNVEAHRLDEPGLADQLLRLADAAGGPRKALAVEITERGDFADVAAARATVAALQAGGVSVALDDFGAAHSSLLRLTALEVDAVKLDKALIHGVADDTRKRAAVAYTAAMCAEMGVGLVAEGVEREADRDALIAMDRPMIAQGYLFARPTPAQAFTIPGEAVG